MKKSFLLGAFLFGYVLSCANVYAQTGDVDPNGNSANICIKITYDLRVTSRDTQTANQVSDLQFFLQAKGYFNSEPTGYFGLLTKKAVIQYQNANGITPAYGFVGPITKKKINGEGCVTGSINGSNTNASYINSITPSRGFGGERIIIRGKNLASGSTVNFIKSNQIVAGANLTTASSDGTELSFILDTRLTSNLLPGIYQINVSNKNVESNRLNFTIGETASVDYKPYISMVRGLAAADFEVDSGLRAGIEGKNLIYAGKDTSVYIDGVKTEVTQYNESVVYFTVPKLLNGTYELYLTTSYGTSNKVKVRVINGTDTKIPEIKVLSPNGGEVFNTGSKMPISFYTNLTDRQTTGMNIHIYRGLPGSSDFGYVKSIATKWLGGSPYEWVIPSDFSAGKYSIYIGADQNVTPKEVTDFSDTTFTINKYSVEVPSIKVISPNGGEVWNPGQSQTIRWTNVGGDNVYIYLSFPDGGTCYIGSSSPDVGYFNFNPTNYQCPNISKSITTGQYKVFLVLSKKGDPSEETGIARDYSDNYFTINSPAVLSTISVSPQIISSGDEIYLNLSSRPSAPWTLTYICPVGAYVTNGGCNEVVNWSQHGTLPIPNQAVNTTSVDQIITAVAVVGGQRSEASFTVKASTPPPTPQAVTLSSGNDYFFKGNGTTLGDIDATGYPVTNPIAWSQYLKILPFGNLTTKPPASDAPYYPYYKNSRGGGWYQMGARPISEGPLPVTTPISSNYFIIRYMSGIGTSTPTYTLTIPANIQYFGFGVENVQPRPWDI